MESGALLLTATITPQPGVPHLRVTDTAQRRQEHLTSLAFAITLDRRIVTTIVFAENSGSTFRPSRVSLSETTVSSYSRRAQAD